jgi:hypothetical protein
MMNDELREVRTLLNAIAQQMELLQWVNGYAVGANEGGSYVSLFNDRLQYRVCTVYQERFRDLPAFITDNIPDEAVEISNDRTVLEKKGLLRPCSLFQIARYKIGEGEKAAWRFSGVVRVSQARQEPEPQAQPAPAPASTPAPVTAFATMAEAIDYSVQRGVYPNYDAARQAYHTLRSSVQPRVPQDMFTAWIRQIEDIAAAESKFTPSLRPEPAPARGGSGSAGHQMRERMAAQPGYAG